MNNALRTFLKFGLAIAKQQIPQIAQIEVLAKSMPTMSGADKQAAAVEMGLASFFAAEGISGKDFADDAEFQRGIRMINDGYVLVLRSIQARYPDV